MMEVKLGNQFVNQSFFEGRLHEALSGINALKTISSPLSSEWGLKKAIQDYLERGTKVRKVPENRSQFHQWISFKKRGGEILVSIWIEDWCANRQVGQKVVVPIPLKEMIEYVEQ